VTTNAEIVRLFKATRKVMITAEAAPHKVMSETSNWNNGTRVADCQLKVSQRFPGDDPREIGWSWWRTA